jgi:DNA replication protein DnaC
MTNENNCLLRHKCKLAGDEGKCNRLCGAFITLQGVSGEGSRISAANIPRQHRLVTLEDAPLKEANPKYHQLLEKALERILYPRDIVDERLSLYLWSETPGTGKTTTASAFVNSFMVEKFIRAAKTGEQLPERLTYFLDMNEWQTFYTTATRPHVPKEVAEEAWSKYYRMMEIAKKVPILVCDDVAVRDVSQPHRSDIHSVINHRVNESMPVVYTSNIPIEELADVFGEERLADRVRDRAIELHFEGESNRGIKKRGS